MYTGWYDAIKSLTDWSFGLENNESLFWWMKIAENNYQISLFAVTRFS